MLFKKDTKWVQKILNEFLVEITHRIFCKNFLQIDENFAKILSDSCKIQHCKKLAKFAIFVQTRKKCIIGNLKNLGRILQNL